MYPSCRSRSRLRLRVVLGSVLGLTLALSALPASAKPKDKDKPIATPLPAAFWPGVASLGSVGLYAFLRSRRPAQA